MGTVLFRMLTPRASPAPTRSVLLTVLGRT
jgi:hypothetical protein